MAPAVLSVNPTSDDETDDLVEDLAEELESFAFERERVLAKLDIRAATLARRIARELRLVLRGLRLAADDESRDGVMSTLGGLLEEAFRVLEDQPAPAAADVAPGGSPGEDMSSRGDDEPPLESGARLRSASEHAADQRAATQRAERKTAQSMPAVSIDDEDEGPQELTIARRVMWERSGNRILGR